MTLASSTARVSYDGDGATASFSTAFSFLENSHVKVVHRSTTGVETTWVLGTQYTLTGAGTGAAGTVTVVTSPTDYTPASGERLVILRNVPLTQNRDLPAAGPFPSATVEGGLDQLTMMVQQIDETLDRTLRFGETSDATATLPDPSANTLIGWNSAGTDLTNIALTAVLADFDSVFTGLADGDFLSYDGATLKWINRTPAEVRGDIDAMQDVFTTRGDLLRAGASGAEERFALGASGYVVGSDGTDATWVDPKTLESAYPPGHLWGLTLSNAADADHDITVATGKCRDDDDTVNLVLASALTKQIDASWAVGTNQGGLDTGSVGNSTTYHVHLIRRSDTGVVDALFSTSATSPTMPTNYDQSRRIGAVITDGSANIRGFVQVGDEFMLKSPVLDVDATNPGTSAVSATLTVPGGVQVDARFNGALVNGTTGSIDCYFSSPDVTDQAASGTAAPLCQLSTRGENTGRTRAGAFIIRTNTSSQIRYRLSASSTSDLVKIATTGWFDRRGRVA